MAGIDNEVVYAENIDFRGVKPVEGQFTEDGHILIGSAVAPYARIGHLTSSDGSVTITEGAGTIDLKAHSTTQNVVQFVYTSRSDMVFTQSVMSLADTIPLITEGVEVFSLSITPKSATSILSINIALQVFGEIETTVVCALFKNAEANSIATAARSINASNVSTVSFNHLMTSDTTSEITYSVRIGTDQGSGKVAINAATNGPGTFGPVFGGTSSCSMTITEYEA